VDRKETIVHFGSNQVTLGRNQFDADDCCGNRRNQEIKDYREKIEQPDALVVRRQEP
jgi:hypothetical protein